MTKKFHILCLLLSLSLYGVQANNYVIINQVMYDTPFNEQMSQPPYCNGEFVELYNGGSTAVSLSGWSLHGGGTTEVVTFADTVSIPSGQYLIVAYRHLRSPRFTLSNYYDLPLDSVSVVYHRSIILKNDEGETLTLYNANSDIIDQITYEGGNSIVSGAATNPDTIQGRQCLSLHRTWVEFDPQGRAVSGTAQWETDTVSFSANMLAQPVFYEHSLTGSQHLPLTDNYIVSVKPLDATTRVSNEFGNISTSSSIRTNTVVNYFDGFGRPEQTVAIGVTPDGNDLVSMTGYAGLKRQTKQWLPVPSPTEGQPLDAASFVADATGFYNDNRPYTETLYENSALNRVTGQKRAGQTYSGHPSSYTYELNTSDDNVRRFEVTSNGSLQCSSQNYGVKTLYKNTTADEDGVAVTTFTDKLGRRIAERRDGHYTYYVYDNMGRLRFVLPHIADSRLTGTLALNDTILQRAAYCYKYDSRGNMTYKRLPGAEPQLMVYDIANHLVLQQNGNQRAGKKWIVYAYDSIGRNLYSAELPLSRTHQQLITFFSDKWQVEHFYSNVPQKKLGTTGYASTLLGNTNIKPLIVNYYDDYAFLNKLPTNDKNALKYKSKVNYGLQYDNAVGMLTGTRVYNLSDGDFTAHTYYYDYKGRVVQSHATRNAGGYEHQYIKYNFDGTVAQQLTEQGTDEDLTTEHYAYTYDHAGRLLTTSYRLNDEPELQLSEHSYDELGRLVQNLRHNSSDTLGYAYDIRGALTNINNYTYSERLFYADSLDEEAIARYNGNIAEMYNIMQSDTGKYSFRYDSQNRYDFSEKLVPRRRLPMESITYDARGNIRSFVRYRDGVTDHIDHLVFDYNQESNQVKNISDNVPPLHFYDDYGYYDQNDSDSICDMEYDANGNLIVDRDRKIKRIAYNYLNLPDTIYFDNGNLIINNYDASGRKYRSTYYTVLATVLTPFTDPTNYNYTNDSIDFYITEYTGNIETYYTREDTTRRVFNTEGYYQKALTNYTDSLFDLTEDDGYYYYYRDHLGTTRVVRNLTKDTTVQRMSYYASGLPMQSCEGSSAQNRKYNGKEFIEAYGLNEYDSQARHYYPAIARTTTMDPLAEKYYSISPYAWCANNPINVVDPMGLDTINIDQEGNIVSTIESDDADVFNIVEKDEDGNYVVKTDEDGNPLSIGFEYGTIENYKSQYSSYYKNTLDWYTIRGDENAQMLFELLATGTNIEWSRLLLGIAGEDGLNVISTSHGHKIENAILFLLKNKYQYGYTIRGHIHNHPENTPYPSGIQLQNIGDIQFAKYLSAINYKIGNTSPIFKIYLPKKRKYIKYSSKSKESDFVCSLPEIVVLPRK